MSRFTKIDLSQLTFPVVLERPDFAAIVAEIKADLLQRNPDLVGLLDIESTPIVMLIEAFAYREVMLRARVNDGAKAVMLAYATGGDLDNLGAYFGVTRLVVREAADGEPAEFEGDRQFRARIQLALEAQSTAGPEGSYIYWARQADGEVKDVSVVSPTPGEVVVTVLANTGDGTASSTLQQTVHDALSAEDVRPLTDHVTVQTASVISYSINATLTFYSGPDRSVVEAEALAAAQAYADVHHLLGHDITRSGLFAALHRPGVQNVDLVSPAADIVIADHEAAYCTGIEITEGGTDV